MRDFENALLRKELTKAVNTISEKDRIIAQRDDTIAGLVATVAKQNILLGFHEGPGQPTSHDTDYTRKRNEFRARRGEDPSGSPGDKAKDTLDDGTGKKI